MYSYKTVTVVGDFGAKILKLICHLPQTLCIGDVKPEQFNVHVTRRNPHTGEVLNLRIVYHSPETAPAMAYRTVTAAYICDEKGAPVAKGEYLALELDENDAQAAAFATIYRMNEFVTCEYRVTQVAPIGFLSGMVFDEFEGDLCPQTERWENVNPVGAAEPLHYGFYTPDRGEGDRPLIIWLHGAGEGGEDARIAYMGNNVVNLSSDEIQDFFGGAYVLAPQTPTFWMNDGSGQYGRTGKSIYVEQLMALIEEFVSTHPIDRSRIYLGGCSNGGFMTMRMGVDYPDYFAALYPMCEALYDERISDEQIEDLKKIPIWFVHAMTDGVVNPEQTSVPTYKRLIDAGAENVHHTYINDRPPRKMVNHFCWVPGLANKITEDFDGKPVLLNGEPTTLFQWLAAQKK